MFDLEQAIAKWRRRMVAARAESPDVLDELESHLREEIDRRISSGSAPQVAFKAAVERLGRPGAIRAEFAKLEPRTFWPRFLRACLYIFPACMLLINLWTLLSYEIPPLERTLGICAVSLICLFLVWLPKLLVATAAGSFCGFARALKWTSSLLFLWPIGALLNSLHLVHLGLGIVATMVAWSLYAGLAMSVFVVALSRGCGRPDSPGGPQPPNQPKGQPIPPTRPHPPEFAVSLPPSRPVDPIVHRSLEMAGDEATRLGHDYVGTEHVLLGLLRLATGPFANLLQEINLDPGTVREELERLCCSAPIRAGSSTLRVTPRAGKALKLAAREAKALNHPCIGAEHVFLGLLLEGSGIAALVLKSLGVRIDRTRGAIMSERRTLSAC
jgi:hypothetical protein